MWQELDFQANHEYIGAFLTFFALLSSHSRFFAFSNLPGLADSEWQQHHVDGRQARDLQLEEKMSRAMHAIVMMEIRGEG